MRKKSIIISLCILLIIGSISSKIIKNKKNVFNYKNNTSIEKNEKFGK